MATDDLRKLVNFRGMLKVRQKALPVGEVMKKGFPRPFDAVRIEVISSDDFQMGYDTGSGLAEMNRVSVGKDSGNTIEFWFDCNDEVLRFAYVNLTITDYKGNIPNPGLGRAIASIKGKCEGTVGFSCVYATFVTPSL